MHVDELPSLPKKSYKLSDILRMAWRMRILAVGIFIIYALNVEGTLGICSRPLEYSIGSYNSNFGVTEAEFLEAAKYAEDMWEDAIGEDLFNYVEGASFEINLVYGELQKNYNELSEYNDDIDDYNDTLDTYNDEVDYWNARGGAPDDIYYDLVAQLSSIERVEADLDRRYLLIDDIEEGETQGEYSQDGVDIFAVENIDDLRVTLAHEMGHALITEHSDDPKSIMYYIEGVTPTEMEITLEDIMKVNAICDFN